MLERVTGEVLPHSLPSVETSRGSCRLLPRCRGSVLFCARVEPEQAE